MEAFLAVRQKVWAIEDEMPDFGGCVLKKKRMAPFLPCAATSIWREEEKVPVLSERRNDPPGR